MTETPTARYPICDHCAQPHRWVDGDGYCDDCWDEVYGTGRREKYQPLLGTPMTCPTCKQTWAYDQRDESAQVFGLGECEVCFNAGMYAEQTAAFYAEQAQEVLPW